MKKSFVLFITILVLGVFVVGFGQNQILAEKDQVKITEQVIYGDKSFVDGVTLKLYNHYEDQIFWDTTYVMGENPIAETEYRFYPQGVNEFYYKYIGSFYFGDTMHTVGFDNNNSVQAPVGLEVAMQDLYDSVGDSEKMAKTFYLKDYMDYYDFSIEMQTPYDSSSGENRIHFGLNRRYLETELATAEGVDGSRYSYSKELIARLKNQMKWLEDFQEFFRIPVLEKDACMMSVEKDADGIVIGWGITTAGGGIGTGNTDLPEFPASGEYDSFSLYTYSYVGEGDVYFTFNTHSYNQEVVDTSLIPGGYGIYHFTYDIEKEEIYSEQLQMVYALDPQVDVLDVTKDASGENLLIFTMEDAETYMTVVDVETMTMVEKFSLSEKREDEGYGIDFCVTKEDYVVVLTYGDIIVFSIEDGNYRKEFEMSRETIDTIIADAATSDYGFELLQWNSAFEWNGEQLIFANHLYNANGYMGTGFYLGVIDANGLQYFATYETSLQSGLANVSTDEYGYESSNYSDVRPIDYDPIVIVWE